MSCILLLPITLLFVLTVELAHLTRKDGRTCIHILTNEEVDALLKEHEETEKKIEAEKQKAEKQKAAAKK